MLVWIEGFLDFCLRFRRTEPVIFRDMKDQRIERRAALGLENTRDRRFICRVRTQAINRLGRESDELTTSQKLSCAGDVLWCA